MSSEEYERAVALYDMEAPTFERAQMLDRVQYQGHVFGMADALWLDHVKLVQMGAYGDEETSGSADRVSP